MKYFESICSRYGGDRHLGYGTERRQLAVTFHGGMRAIAYEWGAPNHQVCDG